MSEYIPDRWVILKFTSKKHGEIRKVFSGWYGGFAGSDDWRLSSGITNIEEKLELYLIHNESGSTYLCYKNNHGMSGYMSSIFASWKKQENEDTKIEIESNETGI